MLAYVARQPIIETNGNTIGYELLFRNGQGNSFPDINPDEATTQIITQNQLTLGLEQICLNKKAFINFHEDSLIHNFPSSLDVENTVIEILEDVPISDALIGACQHLYQLGYTLALDDHEFEERWYPLYPYVSIIKVDIQKLSPETTLRYKKILQPKHPHITWLAERVETHKQFKFYKEHGFTLFQGYYFARPEVISHKAVSSNKLRLLELVTLMSQANIDFDEIADVIEKEPTMSFRLLRFIASSAYCVGSKISTVRHALTYIGINEIRKFVALLAVANLSEHKSTELHNLALIRGKFCEYLHKLRGGEENPPRAYLTGLLSLLSPMLDMPIEEIVPKLPIEDSMKKALLDRTGAMGIYLSTCEAYEKANWALLDKAAKLLKIDADDICEAYHQALLWQNDNPLISE